MIEEVLPRAAQRATIAYRFHPRLTLGLEYNPRADDVGLIGNWVAVTETERRPALIVGTSSDRIGTPEKRALFGTFSKHLGSWGGISFAPNIGASYSGFEERWRVIGGVQFGLPADWVVRVIYDGVNTHLAGEWTLGSHTLALLLVDGRSWGGAYSVSF